MDQTDPSMVEPPRAVGNATGASAPEGPEGAIRGINKSTDKRRLGRADQPAKMEVARSALRGSKEDGKAIQKAVGALKGMSLWPPKQVKTSALEGKAKEKRRAKEAAASPLVEPVQSLVEGLLSESGAEDAAIDAILSSLTENLSCPEIVDYCFSVFFKLASESARIRREVVAKGVLDVVVKALAAFPSKSILQEKGCGIMWIMALDDLTRPAVIAAGACPHLVDVLKKHKHKERVVDVCFGTIKPLSVDPGGRAELEKSDAARAIALAMIANGESDMLQSEGCSLLSNLAVDLTHNQVSVASLEEIQAILESMNKHPSAVAVQKQACLALKNFAVLEKNPEALACSLLQAHELLSHAAETFPQECGGSAKIVLQRMKEFSVDSSSPKPDHKQDGLQLTGNQKDQVSVADELINSAIMAGKHGDYGMAQLHFEEALKLKRSLCGKPGAAKADLVYLLNCIGYVMAIRSDLAGAMEKYKESLFLQQSIRNTDPKNRNVLLGIASTMTTIGMLCMKCGDHDNAEDFFIKALQEKRSIYGQLAGNIDAAKDLENLGDLKRFSGKHKEAEKFYMHSTALYRNSNLAEHEISLSNVMSKLGLVAAACGENDVALNRLEMALEVKRTAYGSEAENADLVDALNNLGYTYAVSGQDLDAIQKYEESLEMQYHMFGEEAINNGLANTLTSLGVLYVKSGQHNTAWDYLEEAFDMKMAINKNGVTSADILGILLNLGEISSLKEAWDEAERFYKQALEVLGEKINSSKMTADVFMKLGHVAEGREDFESAQDYFQKAFDIKKWVYGSCALNEDLAKTLSSIAHAASLRGQSTVAVDKYELSLKMMRNLHGSDASNTDLPDTLTSLGILHLNCGRYDAAEECLTEALSMKRDIHGEDAMNADVANLLRNLGKLHRHRMEFVDAELVDQEALKMMGHYAMNEVSTEVADMRTELGTLAVLHGDMTSALEHFQAALEMKMDICEPDEASLDLVDSLNHLGYAYAAAGDYNNAIVQYEESLRLQQLNQETVSSAEMANTLKSLNILYGKCNY